MVSNPDIKNSKAARLEAMKYVLPLMVSNPDIRDSIAGRFEAMKYVDTISNQSHVRNAVLLRGKAEIEQIIGEQMMSDLHSNLTAQNEQVVDDHDRANCQGESDDSLICSGTIRSRIYLLEKGDWLVERDPDSGGENDVKDAYHQGDDGFQSDEVDPRVLGAPWRVSGRYDGAGVILFQILVDFGGQTGEGGADRCHAENGRPDPL